MTTAIKVLIAILTDGTEITYTKDADGDLFFDNGVRAYRVNGGYYQMAFPKGWCDDQGTLYAHLPTQYRKGLDAAVKMISDAAAWSANPSGPCRCRGCVRARLRR
jgi:hypothetical protein